jgi:hypothetical protein
VLVLPVDVVDQHARTGRRHRHPFPDRTPRRA